MMSKIAIIVAYALVTTTVFAQRDYTTPVPILKQINRHNGDGSYSYGYEGADGSFKIETKYANGEVFGKYGYVDDSGKVREVEYGASRRGFEPQGNDINVPPPTLQNNNPYPLGPDDQDDGQYREDPSVYYKDQKYNKRPVQASNFRLNNFEPSPPRYNPAPAPPAQIYNNPAPAYHPAPPVQPHRFQQQQPQYQQQQQQYYQPPPPQPSYNNHVNVPNHHHPALQNIDIASGSYSVSYTGR